MKWKLTKRGFVQTKDGDRVIRGYPSERWKKWHKENEATEGLSPVEIANFKWGKSKTTMKEFIKKRSKKKWVMP